MAPYYLIRGVYFSYIYNSNQELVVWHVPNILYGNYYGYTLDEKLFTFNYKYFQGGDEDSPFGCCYNIKSTIKEACDNKMKQFFSKFEG